MTLDDAALAREGLFPQHPLRRAARLLREIEAFLEQSKMPVSRFGRLAVKDPRLVQQLREGRLATQRTEDRVREFITANRQEGVKGRA